MINYPKNYAPLAEEEMEYTSGGLSINWMALGSTVMGLATSMLAYLNVSNIAGVAVQLQKKDPEKYPEPEGRSEERRVGKECRSRWSPYH